MYYKNGKVYELDRFEFWHKINETYNNNKMKNKKSIWSVT